MDRDQWMEILQIIARNPVRAFLAGIGVAWGVVLVIIMTGASNGLRNGVTEEMMDVTRNSVFIWTQGTSIPYKGFKAPRYFNLKNSDIEYLRANVPEIGALAPRNQLGGWRGTNNVNRGTKTGAFDIYGDYPEVTQIRPLIAEEGRFISWGDIQHKRKVCAIGTRVRDILFEEGEDAVGGSISINGLHFVVVGVFTSAQTGEDAQEELSTIYTPFSTFQKVFNFGENVGWLSLLGAEGVSPIEAEEAAKRALKQLHSVHPDDNRAFGSWNTATQIEEQELIFGGINIIALVMGVLALIAGMLVISIIMLFNVNDRTREFGVRRSLGATPSRVVWQVLKESMLLTVIAGASGLVFSVAVIEILNFFLGEEGVGGSFKNPEVSPGLAVMCLVAMIFIGLIAGLLPALRAVNIEPVEALRSGT